MSRPWQKTPRLDPKSVKLFPMQSPLFLRALSRRLLRLVLRLTVAALVLIALLYCGLRAYTVYLTHRAVALLDEATRIQVGATEDSILPLVARYGAVKWIPESPVSCDDTVNKSACADHNAHLPDYAYEVDLAPFNVMSGGSQQTGPIRRALAVLMIRTSSSFRDPLSLRDWLTEVQICIRAGRVETVRAELYVEGSTRWLGNGWELSAGMHNLYLPQKTYAIDGSFLTFPGNGGAATEHYLTPAATREQFESAHSFNTRCLAGLIPCRCLADLSPRAFEYMSQHPEVGSTITTPDDCPSPHNP